MADQQHASILSLPRELRDMIWRFAVGDRFIRIGTCQNPSSTQHLTTFDHHHHTVDSITSLPKSRQNGIAFQIEKLERAKSHGLSAASCRQFKPFVEDWSMNLFQTNKQIGQEAEMNFYGTSVFKFDRRSDFFWWESKTTALQRSWVKAISTSSYMSSLTYLDFMRLPALETVFLDVVVYIIGEPRPLYAENIKDKIIWYFGQLVKQLEGGACMNLKRVPISFHAFVGCGKADLPGWRPGDDDDLRKAVAKYQGLAVDNILAGNLIRKNRIEKAFRI